ncbi:MAG: hypothetical protein NC229_08470 [Bacteroides sp.]|nr:hypothetical protein [Bacteroidales bacterium]MCM1068722.1 hypothetical protein [Prevotella sp.]MCM1354678.1 hypothetical protein [Bacteroides sp.]MCM1403774.1 hypothetical protein [Bacteroides sp.]MCM1443508.1 hypothetical protein [Muribaculum sp.]
MLDYGVAESVAMRSDDGEITFPAIVLPNGECYDVYGETDKHDVVFYHRLLNISFQDDDNAMSGNYRGYRENNEMSLIVFGKREKISPIEMEKIARYAIAADNSNTLISSDFNVLQIFASEYAGVTYFMGSAYFLFKINYRITCTYNTGCTNI